MNESYLLFIKESMLINLVVVGSIQVENFERWAQDARVKVMRPNTMNNYGAVLDDIGMEGMLNHLMIRYLKSMAAGASLTHFSLSSQICLLFLLHMHIWYCHTVFLTSFVILVSTVLFVNVGGASLDTHHGFVVEYAMDRDLDLGESALTFQLFYFFPSRKLFFSFS